MIIKNVMSKLFAVMLMSAVAVIPGMAVAATGDTAQTAAAPAAAPAAAQTAEQAPADAAAPKEGEAPKIDENTTVQVQLPYKYTSERYGYTIMCPGKPEVVPASFFDDTAKGDVLIFHGTATDINKAWIILINAYDEADVPDNLGTLPEEEKRATIEKFCKKFNYADASVVDLGDNRYGMYAITAKELDVDTNGDGKFDDVVVASNQMIKTYLKGAFGGHFEITLLDNPTLSPMGIAFYNAGLATFQQWPTSRYQEFLDSAKLPKKKKK
ncbi:MAG: hypothetical protein K6C05_01020 [Anaerovibrio sp.]|uniref:hypothetical protein n=1 Tax=Anaerovibrio sp. TaxID=1872532 RepID=UPI0025FEA3FE|nr:hypothetical protein [Anaerovibrio sp.]MCR5175411.1 hypothetical protein [Anaerovibrio sp.]